MNFKIGLIKIERHLTQFPFAIATRLSAGWAKTKQCVSQFPVFIATKIRTIEVLFKKTLARIFYLSWPLIWQMLSIANQRLLENKYLSQRFKNRVFTRPWNRWYRSAYIPKYRNRFFEYILTFFYDYPIRPGDVVVQIGASSGEETARFAKSVGLAGRVFAIEPETGNINALRRSFPKEQFPQVEIVPKGASNKTGEATFFVGGEREHRLADIPGGALTFEWWGVADHLSESRYKGTTIVSVDTIDNILAEYRVKYIDFILVETNGSELEVVQGMEKTLLIIKRLGVRGHVMRDGVPIYIAISAFLQNKGFDTVITSEGMVLGKRRSS